MVALAVIRLDVEVEINKSSLDDRIGATQELE